MRGLMALISIFAPWTTREGTLGRITRAEDDFHLKEKIDWSNI